jgi:hypothetical protein
VHNYLNNLGVNVLSMEEGIFMFSKNKLIEGNSEKVNSTITKYNYKQFSNLSAAFKNTFQLVKTNFFCKLTSAAL